jgi:hypothetical protein
VLSGRKPGRLRSQRLQLCQERFAHLVIRWTRAARSQAVSFLSSAAAAVSASAICGIVCPCRHTSFAGVAVALRTQVVTLGAFAIDGAIVTGTCTTGVFAE